MKIKKKLPDFSLDSVCRIFVCFADVVDLRPNRASSTSETVTRPTRTRRVNPRISHNDQCKILGYRRQSRELDNVRACRRDVIIRPVERPKLNINTYSRKEFSHAEVAHQRHPVSFYSPVGSVSTPCITGAATSRAGRCQNISTPVDGYVMGVTATLIDTRSASYYKSRQKKA